MGGEWKELLGFFEWFEVLVDFCDLEGEGWVFDVVIDLVGEWGWEVDVDIGLFENVER